MTSAGSAGETFDQTGPSRAKAALRTVLRAPVDRRTYRNLAYLLLQFPLGVTYFTLLVTAGSLAVGGVAVLAEGVPAVLATGGVGLVALVILLPLAVVLVALGLVGASVMGVALLTVDRTVSAVVLGTTFPQRTGSVPFRASPRAYVREWLLDTGMYLSAAAVLAKFVVGVATFVFVVVATTVPVVFVAAPLLYDRPGVDMTVGVGEWGQFGPVGGVWTVDTLPEALLLAAVGVVALLVAVNLVNVFARGLETATRWVCRHARVFDVGE